MKISCFSCHPIISLRKVFSYASSSWIVKFDYLLLTMSQSYVQDLLSMSCQESFQLNIQNLRSFSVSWHPYQAYYLCQNWRMRSIMEHTAEWCMFKTSVNQGLGQASFWWADGVRKFELPLCQSFDKIFHKSEAKYYKNDLRWYEYGQ